MRNRILKLFADCNIEKTGFCAFKDIKERLIPCRALARLPENAKTVILCLFPYKVKQESPQNISRYAAVPDYHKVGMRYLENAAQRLRDEFNNNLFEPFIDNSPIPEVEAAARAGLGVIGENGLLINKKYGSFVFIGEIVTDLELECQNTLKNCCLCGNCKTACPTGVHGAKCLSALSQQKKDLEKEELLMLKENGIVWGCDICAECCPMNTYAELTYIPEFIEGYRDCYTPDEDMTDRAYAWRGEKVIRRNFDNLNSISEKL